MQRNFHGQLVNSMDKGELPKFFSNFQAILQSSVLERKTACAIGWTAVIIEMHPNDRRKEKQNECKKTQRKHRTFR